MIFTVCFVSACGVEAVTDREKRATRIHQARPGRWETSLIVNGRERWFRIYAPAKNQDNLPVVLLLHGGNQSMRKVVDRGGAQEWTGLAEREGILLLVPNRVNPKTGDTKGDEQHWNDVRGKLSPVNPGTDDVAFLEQVVQWAHKTYKTDKNRVYVTGSSNGGMMTYRMLIERPQLFAAGAAVIANLPADSPLVVPPTKPVPILIMNGDRDPVIPFNGGPIAKNRGLSISTRATVDWWVSVNKARKKGLIEVLPDFDPVDRCRVVLERHDAERSGAPVYFFTIKGGGHAMPSRNYKIPRNPKVKRPTGPLCRDVEGVEIIWQFFEQFR